MEMPKNHRLIQVIMDKIDGMFMSERIERGYIQFYTRVMANRYDDGAFGTLLPKSILHCREEYTICE
jgi:hypothetical protein